MALDEGPCPVLKKSRCLLLKREEHLKIEQRSVSLTSTRHGQDI
jgi:hypothetical protein